MKVYSKVHSVTNQARVFILKDQTVTVRLFNPIAGELPGIRDATAEEIAAVTENIGEPLKFESPNYTVHYPASIFKGFTGEPSTKFFLSSGITWTPDPALLGSYNVTDRCSWAFYNSHHHGGLSFMNRGAYSLPLRSHYTQANQQERLSAVMTILQPYADSKLEDCVFFVYFNEGKGYLHNFADVEQTEISELRFFPEIQVSGPAQISASGYVDVDVKVITPATELPDSAANTELYLEGVAGYLPKQRCTIANGLGRFKVGAIGLDVGDAVKVKIGWKNWPGEAEFKSTVV
jgi:hypothetical protein